MEDLYVEFHYSGGFMYINSREGIFGDKALLQSVDQEFPSDTCLSFMLFLNFTGDEDVRNFR